ncbi:universal stress protein [Halobellus limi]|uniref:Universal stress protein n=1 Tax=Halobellus limi TaxID=699433 RepID=A0A1H6BGF9_9EURY|nr:universal stress protein [Halobellus limi]QCC49008.1 universal stress protein [Halobellus limi]SEG59306.1 Nucleotide-binding universal stress protein, UspA family [Halobellus limi]
MYDDILLPFDGSDGAAEALHHAAEIAHWADATIHVLFVADTTRDSVTVVETRVVDALVQEGEDTAEEAEKTLNTLGVDHGSDVVQGNPAPTIVEYAERYEYDLIVMPTHGREGMSRYLIGSVTEKVVRLSPVPVLTARMRADERLVFPYENILIPTDGSAGAAHAAEYGLALAAALDATVHVLSVVDETSLGPDVRSTISGREREQAATDAVDDVASEAETRGVSNAVRHVEHGSPIEVLLDTVESNGIHAVVMGTTGRRGSDRILLGSVAEKTVRSAPVPVITVGGGE